MSSKSTTREHLQFIQAVYIVPYILIGGCCYGWCCTGVVVSYGQCCAVVMGGIILLLCCCMGGVVWAVLSRNNDGD